MGVQEEGRKQRSEGGVREGVTATSHRIQRISARKEKGGKEKEKERGADKDFGPWVTFDHRNFPF